MEEALRAKLLGNAAIAAMVTGVAWIERPNGAKLPSITLMQIAPGRDYSHDGASDLSWPLVQFDFWGASQVQCLAMQRLVQDEMETPGTVRSVAFDAAFLEAEHDGDAEDIEGGIRVYRRISEWRIYNRKVGQ